MQALRTGRVSHAYLFSGPRGCGKTTSARILARCLNCEQGPTPIPCGVCDSCVALARDGSGSVDVIEIDAASHGGVDDARDLRERASYGPAQSRYKIYIIDEAHMVTPQGFNALLKIVEEPPEHVKFIFATTQPDKVIGTIRSRTHHYPFRLVPPLRLQDYLGGLCAAEGVAVAPGVLSFVVRAGGGSVRDSLSVLDQLMSGSGDEGLTYQGAAALLGFTEGEMLDATIDGLAAGDAGAVFRQIDKVIETGHDPRRFVEDLPGRLGRLERRLEMSGAPASTGPRPAASVREPAVPSPRQASRPSLSTPPVRGEPVPGRTPVRGVAPGPLLAPPAVPPGDAQRSDAEADVEPAPVQERPGAAVPGGIDTDAIRRSWPDILAKIFTIRRTTWTFLSEHTQVLDYDGTRLLLGIQTEGLATTFRRGQHAELVRQALSEVLGVEAVVEGIPTAQLTRSVSPTTAAAPQPAAPQPAAPQPAAPQPAAAPPAPAPPAVAAARPPTPMQRARAAVAQEVSTRNTSSLSSVADDSMLSADDENIDEAVAVGQPVIARVLGGTVIDELDQ